MNSNLLTAEKLSGALKGAVHQGYFMACCPAHDDEKASLSICEKDGKVLLRCHAGCSQEKVVEALKARNLWPDPKKTNGAAGPYKRIVATYDYVDELGALQFQAVRTEPKGFFQRRPDGQGGYINGCRILLYRLPEVIEAISQGREVLIVEGEKDADNLGALGFAATCNADGALKWKPEHAAFLQGAAVVIIPDNDDPGRRHAQQVVKSLKDIAARIRILNVPDLPEKGDVSDWLAAGGDAEKLRKLIDGVPDLAEGKVVELFPTHSDKKCLSQKPPPTNVERPAHWAVKSSTAPVQGAELLDGLVRMLKRFLVLPDHAAEAMALWIVHAWTIEHAEISPLLSILSPTKQCGKTTVLTLIFYLTPRSVLASNISPAALLRYVEQEKPTLIIDEADTFAIDDEALRGVLNSGHNRATAQVIRCDGPNLQPRTYSTFAPKVLAAIGQLPATVMDRSLIIEMRRKRKTESVERLRARDNTEFAELRSALQRWSEDHGPYLQDCEPAVPDHLDNRPADNRRPLLAIADQAGNSWPELARSAALALSGGAEDSDRGVELLADIRRLLHEESRERFGAEELVNRLIGIEEAPWREWRSDGRGITSRGISVLLKPFGIKSQKRRTGRFYERAEFAEAWDSYLPILPTFPP